MDFSWSHERKSLAIKLFIFMFILIPNAHASDTLTFATHTKPPLSSFLQEVLQQALKPHNKTVNVIEMPGRRVIHQVNHGMVVGDAGRASNFKVMSNDDTSNYIRVNEAIALISIVMITRKPLQIKDPSWHELNQGTVAYLNGSKHMRKRVNRYNRVPVSTNIQALEMLARDRVRAVAMFEATARDLISKNSLLSEELLLHQPEVDRFNLYTYINKNHAELVPLLEKSLKKMKKSGKFKKIADKYDFSMSMQLSTN